jgi:hypothetical protein
MKHIFKQWYCLIGTIASLLICGGLATFGTEYDTYGFFWVGFVSGMYMMIGVRGIGILRTMFRESRNDYGDDK